MRVRAAGSSGVTTVNTVETTVKGEGVRNEEKPRGRTRLAVTGSMKRRKYTQGHRQKKICKKKIKRNNREEMKGEDLGDVEETGWKTINTEHQDAAGSD